MRSYISESPEQHVGLTEVLYFTTKSNRPIQPMLHIIGKTETSLTLKWNVLHKEKPMINYYLLDMFSQPDDYKYLDLRNYCMDPIVPDITDRIFTPPKPIHDCCISDVYKELDMYAFMHTLYGRSRNCDDNSLAPECQNIYISRAKRYVPANQTTKKRIFEQIVNYDQQPMSYVQEKIIVKRQVLENDELPFYKGDNDEVTVQKSNEFVPFKYSSKTNNVTINNLKPYTLYSMMIYACTEEHKCSVYYLESGRTLPSCSSDEIQMVLINSSLSEGSIQFFVEEPKAPNGVIVGYNFMYSFKSLYEESDHKWCITRKDHAKNNYM